jgi:MarR family transcriptional regulator, transcriptional regulator for hemolysin
MEELNDIIFYSMDKAIKTYRVFAQKQLRQAGYTITIDQWLTIKCLLENPDISQQELAEKVFKDNASVTRILDLLVKAGYLERQFHESDRRRFKLIVTESGVETIENVQKIVLQNRATALQGISIADIESVEKVFNQIINNCKS